MTPQPGTPEFKEFLDELETGMGPAERISPDLRCYMTIPELKALINGCRLAERYREALEHLAVCEANYRKYHDSLGGSSIESGRAWDLMRRVGDQARATLNPPQSIEGGA